MEPTRVTELISRTHGTNTLNRCGAAPWEQAIAAMPLHLKLDVSRPVAPGGYTPPLAFLVSAPRERQLPGAGQQGKGPARPWSSTTVVARFRWEAPPQFCGLLPRIRSPRR
uniref:Uncharacterized protein n=1 Tax=Oryza meridionalis TaxID=40149 RepID=A0A0E0CKN2_9ORYZ